MIGVIKPKLIIEDTKEGEGKFAPLLPRKNFLNLFTIGAKCLKNEKR